MILSITIPTGFGFFSRFLCTWLLCWLCCCCCCCMQISNCYSKLWNSSNLYRMHSHRLKWYILNGKIRLLMPSNLDLACKANGDFDENRIFRLNKANTPKKIFSGFFLFFSIRRMEYGRFVACKNGEITMIWNHRIVWKRTEKCERNRSRPMRKTHAFRQKVILFNWCRSCFFFSSPTSCVFAHVCVCVHGARDCRFNIVIMLMKYHGMSVNLRFGGWCSDSCIRPQLVILLVKFDFHHNETAAGHNSKV